MKLRLNSLLLCSVALTIPLGLVVACSTTNTQEIDYVNPIKSSETPLVRPPNIESEVGTKQRLQADGKAELSAYQHREHQDKVEPIKNVLKPVSGLYIQRDGAAHWLVVQHKTPAQLWPQLRQFWQEQDFSLALDVPEHASMETAWKQTRADIKLSFIHQTLSKSLGSAYITAEKNKYRTRVEAGKDGATYIFISQLGMHEVSTGLRKEWTRWETTPNNPTLEIAYLQRLMYALTPEGEKTRQLKAAAAAQKVLPALGAIKAKNKTANLAVASNLETEALAPQVTQFNLAQPFDRAWLRVGLALDQNNFTVDDRDREHGFYYLRYVDPHDKAAEQQGFWQQVFHGKKEKIAKQYKLNVRALSEAVTRVAVVNEAGEIDTSPQASSIVSRLAGQLK